MARARVAKRTGLQPQTFKGLNKKRIEQRPQGSGKRVVFGREDPTVSVQFLQTPEDFTEFNIHAFQEDGRWHFVPCAGKDVCPLDDDEDSDIARTNYRFACNVLNTRTGKVQILEGPKTLAGLIFYRYERKPSTFTKRVFDVTKFPTTPVTYNLELAEEEALSTRGKRLLDMDEYLLDEMRAYYGDDLENVVGGDLSDDDEDEDEDFEDDE